MYLLMKYLDLIWRRKILWRRITMDNDLIHCWMKFIKIYFKYYFVTVSRLELKTLEKCISGTLQVCVSFSPLQSK